MVMAATGDEPMTITCTILRVEPPMLLEHTHVDPGSYMRWELEPVDTGCVLRLSHFVTDAAAAIDNCYVVGLHASLARLAPCLAGRPIAWDWDGFADAQAHYASIGLAPDGDCSVTIGRRHTPVRTCTGWADQSGTEDPSQVSITVTSVVVTSEWSWGMP